MLDFVFFPTRFAQNQIGRSLHSAWGLVIPWRPNRVLVDDLAVDVWDETDIFGALWG